MPMGIIGLPLESMLKPANISVSVMVRAGLRRSHGAAAGRGRDLDLQDLRQRGEQTLNLQVRSDGDTQEFSGARRREMPH